MRAFESLILRGRWGLMIAALFFPFSLAGCARQDAVSSSPPEESIDTTSGTALQRSYVSGSPTTSNTQVLREAAVVPQQDERPTERPGYDENNIGEVGAEVNANSIGKSCDDINQSN